MAKENPDTKPKPGKPNPFRRFEDLARKIVRVRKEQVREKPKS